MSLILPQPPSSRLGRDLKHLLGAGKVQDDASTLKAYAVDASIYTLTPQAVVLPETEEDIDRVVDYAVSKSVPLTARAAGTNLTGSAIGTGVIVDISRMRSILEVNREEKWARVQPGIVLAQLNRELSAHGLMFGPDPSSGEMCKLGGMLANNSAGPHSLRYGAVKDNVHRLRVRLLDGGWLDARAYGTDDPMLERLYQQYPAVRSFSDAVHTHQALIQSKRPQVSKNSCGYNLFDVSDGLANGVLDLPKLFVGSEGTLGVFSEATLRLVDRPVQTASALLHFTSLEEMGEAIPHLLTLSPSALEVMDGNTLNLIGRGPYGIPSDAAATVIIEFDQGEDPGRSEQLLGLCRRYRLAATPVVATDGEMQQELWKSRKALYPTLYRFDARKRPINFVDDVVVPADRTAELIRYLEGFFGDQRVPVAVFGHVGNGNAHILPLLDLNDTGDFSRMVKAHREVHRVVLDQFGGSLCGEHGDGRIRAEMVREMFGEDLYRVFVDVKGLFDPHVLLNPGVKISHTSFTEHIDFERLGKSCATCAKCNAVCPVYDVFQSEDMSSRGWFEIMTAPDYDYPVSERAVEACLNCKSCRSSCPAGVDVSELILRRRAEHPNQAMGWVFALHARPKIFEPLLKVAAYTQGLWDRPWGRAVLERLALPLTRRISPRARVARDLRLPRLAMSTLRERFSELIPTGPATEDEVAYFHGCAANYFDDGVGEAVIGLLRHRLGRRIVLPRQRCSGTPIETYGHRGLAKDGARENLKQLAGYGTVVTGCASCTLSLKDYPRVFEHEPEYEAAVALSERVKHISEMVEGAQAVSPGHEAAPVTSSVKYARRTVTYHSSCHLRAAGVTRAPREALKRLPGVRYVEMADADRCAGGAGTYLIKEPDTSAAIFERKRRAIHDTGAEIVATSCPACMIQLNNQLRGAVDVQHIAQLLYSTSEQEPGSQRNT